MGELVSDVKMSVERFLCVYGGLASGVWWMSREVGVPHVIVRESELCVTKVGGI